MKSNNSKAYQIRKIADFLICAIIAIPMLLPIATHSQGTEKTVRVGWYESPFNITDEHGRRSGYAYEYQRKIAAYTGWNYEYVEGSWPDLLQMLVDGEIDLMSDVSYTEERAQKMRFSASPMGSEEYYLFIDVNNTEITQDDYSTLNRKKIGVYKGSVQIGLFEDWAKAQGVKSEIIEMTCSVEEALRMLQEGEIDVYLALDSYGDPDTNIPIARIGSSDFYFAVNNNRQDLLEELNVALSKIQSEDKYFNEQLSEKYTRTSSANLNLTVKEQKWLDSHGPIRVGYQDDYMAFCAADENGELTGALKDYLELAEECFGDVSLKFEPVAYPTKAAVIEALKSGEIDCMFPANLTDSDAENMGAIITPPVMTTEVYALVRKTEQQSFVIRHDLTAAVDENNTIFEMFLSDHFPGIKSTRYHDTLSCLNAVADKEVDCLMISNYRFNSISHLCDKLRLTTVPTGVSLSYGFAIFEGQTELYSVLTRITKLVPVSNVNAALNYYSTEDTKVGFGDFVRDNLATAISIISVIAIIVLLLILKNAHSAHRASRGEKLISATEHDEITGLYNKNFFFEYAEQIQKKSPGKLMDAVAINIEHFHFVNEMNGHDFGDKVLYSLGAEILAFLNETEGIGSRFSADVFAIFCKPQEDYWALLNCFQDHISKLFPNKGIILRMGVMQGRDGLDIEKLIDRASVAANSVRGTGKHLMVYDDVMDAHENLKLRLLSDIDRALVEHEFKVYYQPKYDIQCDPPKFVSAEALVRWEHPDLGMVSPADFIPLLESTGQIYKVDKYVWHEAARQIAAWREELGMIIPVSVNISRIDVIDPSFEETIDALIKEFAIDRHALKLEVTESAYTENADQISGIIKRLREKGHEIEIDDFGSGYSSLNMLSSMPIDVLKMDMNFVQNIEHSEKDMRLVEMILDIAKNLQVPVIAEGVETEKQMMMLRSAGCALVQGYYFSRPLSASDFEKKIIRDEYM